MKRKQPYEIEKVTLNLRKGDFARMRELFPQLGSGPAVARLLIGYLRKVDEGMAEKGLVEPETAE